MSARAASFLIGTFAVVLATAASSVRAGPYTSFADLDRGHAILLKSGLQIQAAEYAVNNGWYEDLQAWHDAGFAVDSGLGTRYRPTVFGAPGDFQWSLTDWQGSTSLDASAQPYLPYLVAYQYLDEQDITQPQVITQTADYFAQMHAKPEFNHVIFFANQAAHQETLQQIQTYMAAAKPDMLMFDSYYWNRTDNGTSPTNTYLAMSKYRTAALAGNDGTGQHPIPYGRYLQAITDSPQNRMSESQIRLEAFSSWAFGFQYTSAFAWDQIFETNWYPQMFDGQGATATKTPQFDYWRETNRQSRNLGPALVRLLSTDVRIVNGVNSNPNNGIAAWTPTADPYMKSITALNEGDANGGQPGDVLIGYFTPLVQPLNGAQFNNQEYFMIVNGLSQQDMTSAETEQMITILFDFGNSGITSLLRCSRDNGQIESVPLIHDSGSLYELDLLLNGGEGDLFKYDTGAPFVTVPEPSGVALLACSLAAAVLHRRRRRGDDALTA